MQRRTALTLLATLAILSQRHAGELKDELTKTEAARADAVHGQFDALLLQAQMGRLPEARMLLMSGLMLADRTASVEDELRQAKAKILELEGRPVTEREVAVLPREVTETLAELAARAEALADMVEQRVQ